MVKFSIFAALFGLNQWAILSALRPPFLRGWQALLFETVENFPALQLPFIGLYYVSLSYQRKR
jgi:hypothetical protein